MQERKINENGVEKVFMLQFLKHVLLAPYIYQGTWLVSGFQKMLETLVKSRSPAVISKVLIIDLT